MTFAETDQSTQKTLNSQTFFLSLINSLRFLHQYFYSEAANSTKTLHLQAKPE